MGSASPNSSIIISIIIMKIIVLAAFIVVALAETYRKVVHEIDSNAKCLDGSSAALYLHEGDPQSILFYLQGGGVCGSNSLSESLESCYQRSKTTLGSSLYWPETLIGQGILSTDPSLNILANWTKVILIYCDGSFHQGFTNDPYSYKDSKLYFRGSANTRAHFQYIHQLYNLTNAGRVIISGSSAGGIAALSWAEYLSNHFFLDNKLSVIADSAVLLKIDANELSNIYKLSNRDELNPNKACSLNFGPELAWRCLSFEGILPFIDTQTLFLQSAYDYFIITQRLMVDCLQQGKQGYSLTNCNSQMRGKIQNYRIEYLDYIGNILFYNHSIWSIDCSQHAIMQLDKFYSSSSWRVPMEEGRTMEDAVTAWVFEGKEVVDIDLFGWPMNSPCSQ